MKLIVKKDGPSTHTVHGEPTRRGEKWSSWYYQVTKANLARVCDQVVAEVKGQVSPE